jgi:hypothetical protein
MAQGGLGTLIPDLIIPRPVQAFSCKLMKIQEKILVNVFSEKEVIGEGGAKLKKQRQLGDRKNGAPGGIWKTGTESEFQ